MGVLMRRCKTAQTPYPGTEQRCGATYATATVMMSCPAVMGNKTTGEKDMKIVDFGALSHLNIHIKHQNPIILSDTLT